ncbi:MAG: hypothetical protein JXB35_10490 [Anaerolineae bacterium]|nr:hypothetical protein [Anaerolineae bacterium]
MSFGLFGFPRRDFEIVRLPTPPTEGTALTDGSSSGTAYSLWKTEIELLQTGVLAGVHVAFFRANTFTLYLLDASDVEMARSGPLTTTSTSVHSRYFQFVGRPMLLTGERYRLEMQIATTTERMRYTTTKFVGDVYKETQSWLGGGSNNAHMVLQLAFARDNRRVWYQYY